MLTEFFWKLQVIGDKGQALRNKILIRKGKIV